MYKSISQPIEISGYHTGVMVAPMFCESYSSITISDKNMIKLVKVKIQRHANVSRKLDKDNTFIKKAWGTPINIDIAYCTEHDSYVINSNLILGFLEFSDEQMKSKDSNLDTEWTSTTLEDATVEANKKLDEMIKAFNETKGKRLYI